MNELAVLMTCFNRKNMTVNCLERLLGFDISMDVFLVDDDSSDGTYDLVQEKFPEVNLIKGNGDLFWNRGMHKAWTKAVQKKDYKYFLWLNDDVCLYSNAFVEILECSKQKKDQAIISGIIESENKKDILYGGFDSSKKKIKPNGGLQKINFLNGNFVLVPKDVYQQLGNLDSKYHHDLGDVDYGLRAKKKGIDVVTTKCVIGSGEENNISRERLNNTNLLKRFRKLYSPLGGTPFINFYYRKKHIGFGNALVYFVFLNLLNVIPDSLNTIIFKDKYK